jgi:hypothetical protein
MRHELAGAMLAGVLALAGAVLQSAPVSSPCDQASAKNGNYVKPSSLVPHERAWNNAYGAPIPKPIVSRHVPHKPKAQPQLRTSPLPGA